MIKEGGCKYNDPFSIWDKKYNLKCLYICISEEPSFPTRTILRKLKLTYGCLFFIIH